MIDTYVGTYCVTQVAILSVEKKSRQYLSHWEENNKFVFLFFLRTLANQYKNDNQWKSQQWIWKNNSQERKHKGQCTLKCLAIPIVSIMQQNKYYISFHTHDIGKRLKIYNTTFYNDMKKQELERALLKKCAYSEFNILITWNLKSSPLALSINSSKYVRDIAIIVF